MTRRWTWKLRAHSTESLPLESINCELKASHMHMAYRNTVSGLELELLQYDTPDLSVKSEKPQRGRPIKREADIVDDLTYGQVLYMRRNKTSMEEIAKQLGVSRRTLYRRLESINGLNLDMETPYSQWP